MTEQQTASTGDSAPAPPVVAPPPVTTQPPVGQQPTATFEHSDVFDPEGKKWRDRFHGYTGALQQQRQQHEDAARALGDEIASLKATIAERDTQLGQLRAQIGDLEAQAAMIPTLNQQIEDLLSARASADKLAIMLEYPQLLNLVVTEETPTEDGGTTKVTHNPVRALIETSTLEGDALRRQIEQLAAVYRVSTQPVQQQQQPPYSSPTPPTPAAQVEETATTAREKALQLQNEIIAGGDYSASARDKIRAAWQKVHELEREESG